MLLSSKRAAAPNRPPGRRRGNRRLVAGIALAVALALQLAVSPAAPASAAPDRQATDLSSRADLTTKDVTFRGHGGVTLHGTVVAPAAPGPRRPGIVFVHGAGPRRRVHLIAEAEALARAGMVTLIYDKRTEGYSLFQRSYPVLAEDALAAVRTLRAQDGVDPDSVGLRGLSEGGWVAPLAASRSGDVAFLVTIAANGRTPARQQAWADDLHLRDAGVTGSLLRSVRTLTRLAVDAGVFAEAHHDPVPVLEQVRQPVLALWGTMDKDTPPRESARIFQQVLARSGNRHATIRFFPGADHSLHRTTDGYSASDDLTPGYPEMVASWVQAVGAGRAPASSADPPPPQDRQTTALAPLAWWESPWITLGAAALCLVAFASYPVTAVVRRLRGRRGAPPARRPARWLAAAGPATVIGFLVFMLALRFTAAEDVGPVVLGRPVVWLALQLAAVSMVVATAAAGVAWWRGRYELPGGTRARLALVLTGGAVFVPWALYWGLLLP